MLIKADNKEFLAELKSSLAEFTDDPGQTYAHYKSKYPKRVAVIRSKISKFF